MREDGIIALSGERLLPTNFLDYREIIMKFKRQNIFWGGLFILLGIIAAITEAVEKTAQQAGEKFFVGYIIACSVFGVIGIVYLVLGVIGIFKGTTDKKNRRSDTKAMCTVAMFCAVAYVLTYIKLPVSFLSLEVKDAMIVLCALILGPMAGLKIALIVPFIEMITHSDTGVYGLIMNILSSATFAFVAGIIYRYKRSFYGAIVSLVSGVFSVLAVMMVANIFVTPLFMGVPVSVVIEMMPTLFLPFNLVKPILNAAIVLLLYKPCSTVLKRTRMIEYSLSDKKESGGFNLRSLIVTILAAIVIAAAICFVVFIIIPAN